MASNLTSSAALVQPLSRRSLTATSALLLGAAFLLLFAWFGWPTQYRYESMGYGHIPVRINRFTGEAERLTNTGWQLMMPELPPGVSPFEFYVGDKNPAEYENAASRRTNIVIVLAALLFVAAAVVLVMGIREAGYGQPIDTVNH